ncbi:MAG: tyrosine-protein phosphatase [Sphingomonas sp.]|nr:tyrosine-protein phosphatase [Sphingomonas sp.]
MADRVLPFAGIYNFRDYGGYTTGDRGKLRKGVLFRSGQHVDATPDDLQGVAALSLRTVIDLRGNRERAAWPCARPGDFDAQVLFFDGETSDDHGEQDPILTAADAEAAMVALYAHMPFRHSLQGVLHDYFAALASREGAALVHCFAGKDRTGFAVALLHTLLGVHADDVMADYLLTNSVGNAEARIAAGADSIRRIHGPDITDGAIRTLMGVAPAYLEAAFSALRLQYGSVDGYAQEVLAVDDTRLSAIRSRVVN